MVISKINKSFFFFIFLLYTITFIGCSSDENLERKPVKEDLLTEAKSFLNGDIILSTKATMNGIDKTLLPSGCPTKFHFSWDLTDKNILTIKLDKFTVGKMPFVVTFACNTEIMQLNSFEKDEYKGDSWIKFKGKNGYVIADDGKSNETANGSFVKGYYNVKTHEINFIVDYNMMNVRSECFLQTIDKNRINNYTAEFKKYEEDLKAYKKDHGLQ
jgi:hypothetical protein